VLHHQELNKANHPPKANPGAGETGTRERWGILEMTDSG
jgi:hypothetical protein